MGEGSIIGLLFIRTSLASTIYYLDPPPPTHTHTDIPIHWSTHTLQSGVNCGPSVVFFKAMCTRGQSQTKNGLKKLSREYGIRIFQILQLSTGILESSVAEPHHFYAAPGENFDASSAPSLLYRKAKIFKRT
jgi:hypothetical protein